MDPRASSGKILRVKSRYPESFRFLGLWTTLLTGVGARDANASKKYGFWSFMTTITGRW